LKIKYKITILFTVLVTIILLIITFSVYYLTGAEGKKIFDKRLKSRATSNAQIYDYFGDTSILMLRRIDSSSLAILPLKSVIIADTNGNILYRHEAPHAEKLVLEHGLIADIINSNETYFQIGKRQAIGFYYPDKQRPLLVVVAAFDEDGELRLAELRQILGISALIGVLITLVIGFLFSSQLVRPLRNIITEVNDISSHNLSKQLRVGNSHDEMNELGKTFNNLLNRLQESFNTQRRFISNASHEISTPLTSISSQLQVTLNRERTKDEYQQVLRSIQEDVDQMRQLTKSLLEIAKTGGSHGSIELKELRIDELIMKVISEVKRMNQDYEVELQFQNFPETERMCLVFGNWDLLYSAIKNIVENGCKYSPDKRSFVNLCFENDFIEVQVENKGDVIAEHEIEQIFQPFYRGDNTTEIKGFGLGLSLAKRIISIHKGEIKVNSGPAGTKFFIVLPYAGKV
jgi:signal transduction histidine kinase